MADNATGNPFAGMTSNGNGKGNSANKENTETAKEQTVAANTEVKTETETNEHSVFAPVTFICNSAPELGFRGVDGKRTKFTNKQYRADTPEAAEHVRKLIREGGLNVHGVQEVNRAQAENVAKAFLERAGRANAAIKGGTHSASMLMANSDAYLAARDEALKKGGDPTAMNGALEQLERDGLIVTEAAKTGTDKVQ